MLWVKRVTESAFQQKLQMQILDALIEHYQEDYVLALDQLLENTPMYGQEFSVLIKLAGLYYKTEITKKAGLPSDLEDSFDKKSFFSIAKSAGISDEKMEAFKKEFLFPKASKQCEEMYRSAAKEWVVDNNKVIDKAMNDRRLIMNERNQFIAPLAELIECTVFHVLRGSWEHHNLLAPRDLKAVRNNAEPYIKQPSLILLEEAIRKAILTTPISVPPPNSDSSDLPPQSLTTSNHRG